MESEPGWRRRAGVIRFEKGTGVNVGGHLESILDGGHDAALEDRDLRFIVGLILAVLVAAGAMPLLAMLVGWA